MKLNFKNRYSITSILFILAPLLFINADLLAQGATQLDSEVNEATEKVIKKFNHRVFAEIIENKGQIKNHWNGEFADDVLFFIPRNDGNLLIRKTGFSIQHTELMIGSNSTKHLQRQQYRMDIELVNANKESKVVVNGKSKFYRNYYFSASDFVQEVHDYKSVKFQNVYPNIDWIVYVKDGKLKYDFIIHPGGDPSSIQLRVKNSKGIDITDNGSLRIASPLGEYIESKPVSIQSEEQIETSFKINSDIISFNISEYDTRKTLVVDPEIKWGTSVRSKTNTNGSESATLDVCERSDNGSISVLGINEVDELASVTKLSSSPDAESTYYNSYILHLDSSKTPLWVLYFPSNANGNVFMTNSEYTKSNQLILGGLTSKSGLSKGSNIYQSQYSDSNDLCLASIDSVGGISWFSYYGGSGEERYSLEFIEFSSGFSGYSYEFLKVNSLGDIVLFGFSTSKAGMTSANGIDTSNNSGTLRNIMASFSSTDGSLNWGTYLHGTSNGLFNQGKYNRWSQLLIDKSDNIYVLGESDMDSAVLHTENENISEIALVTFKLNKNGSYLWRKFLNAGPNKFMYVNGGAITNDNKLLIVGSTNTDTFDIAVRHEGKGSKVGYDGYLMQLDSSFSIEWYSFKYVDGFDKMWKVSQKESGVIVVATEYYTGSYQKICTDQNSFYTRNPNNKGKLALLEFQPNGLWMNTWVSGATGTQVHESAANRLYYSKFQDAIFSVGGVKGKENELNTKDGFDTTIYPNEWVGFFMQINTEYDSMLQNTTANSEIVCYNNELVIKPASTNSPFTSKANLVYTWTPSSLIDQTKSNSDSVVTIKITTDTTIISRIEDACVWDSVHIRIRVLPTYKDTFNIHICPLDSVKFSDGNVFRNITRDTFYTATLQTIDGCDSLEYYNITVNPTSTEKQQASICIRGSYTFPDGTTFNNVTSDTFQVSTLKNQYGCDSVIRTTLSVTFTIGDTTVVTECTEYQWNDSLYTKAGIYSKSFTGVDGCDSFAYLDLRLNKFDTTMYASSCSEYTWEGKTYDSSGTYEVNYKTYLGCDSIRRLTLSIGSYLDTIIESSCFSYQWLGKTYTQSGNYSDTALSILGCDSITTLVLTINTVDTSVTVSPTTILSNSSNSTYQWLDCKDGFSVLAGEISQRFYATANGDYAVEVTENTGCVDTSSCVSITGIIESNGVFSGMSGITGRIYPNPSSGIINIEFDQTQKSIHTELRNFVGQKVQENYLGSGESFQIDIQQPSGIYQLTIYSNGQMISKLKLIKQ